VPEFRQQLLGCRFNYEFESPDVAAALELLRIGAHQDLPLQRDISFRVHGQPPALTIVEDDRVTAERLSINEVVARLYARVFDHLQETETAGVCLHGVCGDRGERRFLVCGDSGAGKTTLATHLAFAPGFHVSGDDSLLIDAGLQATPLPRRFMLRAGSRPLLPCVEPLWDDLPGYVDTDGNRIRALDPTAAGLRWEIHARPVAAVIRLRRGEPGGWREVSPLDMVQGLMRQTFASMTPLAHGAWITRLSALVNATACLEYGVTDLARTAHDFAERLG